LKRLPDFCANIRLRMERKMIIGYARVSTNGQSLESQDASLRAAGAERIYAEKVSGAPECHERPLLTTANSKK
jgi:DNA invertase Pin-like site-specific DNA recombinase